MTRSTEIRRLVAHDVAADIRSPEAARDIYGVVVEGGTFDATATDRRRGEIRGERVTGAVLPPARPALPTGDESSLRGPSVARPHERSDVVRPVRSTVGVIP